ncbi:hypothetical protein OG875_09925 [Streptomyces sp. NBC_01498]|uniref:hypothetical protein n=1 Tax=Streptomyces sp. NBC_01498 TaxID=2975870 RepID=UPI002E7AE7FF|nr:hypothetical protein [Streptomyces sp. NBC_01498]WTL24891.1 hypothetical protein OG875_09925 [Streptomyces sp. NBC_01498]
MALTVSLTACGSGDGGGKDDAATSSAAPGEDKSKDDDGGTTVPDTSQTLATINGDEGIQLVVHTAVRDEAGFLTVTGTLKNTTSQRVTVPISWNGDENQVRRTGRSLAGMTLVDKQEKKRYFVLRDTEGHPLTTTGISTFKAEESFTVFAQFPAPPDSTSQVDLLMPTMPAATIEIS